MLSVFPCNLLHQLRRDTKQLLGNWNEHVLYRLLIRCKKRPNAKTKTNINAHIIMYYIKRSMFYTHTRDSDYVLFFKESESFPIWNTRRIELKIFLSGFKNKTHLFFIIYISNCLFYSFVVLFFIWFVFSLIFIVCLFFVQTDSQWRNIEAVCVQTNKDQLNTVDLPSPIIVSTMY